ncbi:MAG: hypothetical protein QGG40_19205, partial [Myxococcota bacterium]|nr:hypothetical protein [Myxococcota bacterium]
MAQVGSYRGLVLVVFCGAGTPGCRDAVSAPESDRSGVRVGPADPALESTGPGEWVQPVVPDISPFEGTAGL